MAELHVELVAADRKVWSGEATRVVARTSSGDIGIMAGHQPLLGVLESGPVTIRTTGESGEGTVVAAVHGGFISFAENKLSLLAEIAELSDEVDVDRAERALERAKSDDDAHAERRAEVRLAAASHAR
ncbi:ATP synthase epsilon chain [Streptomyces sp. RB5]|uniref:ATP synthase epsilon chain n=1 Tax=Streptomyces smaragdinus TaxID=2585196 RepID=A0A7K0CEX4_9ACTN|nr:F0F1 ATP synthase subunit epsilon [Streptomyces smaragdinus]MQY12018.1 ATP synthase epsilon chain [Streptomyces smaragdinus]